MKILDRAGVIRESLLVFYYGLAGLIPVIGLLPATVALVRGLQLRRRTTEPNPAENYRKWGMALGACSLLLNSYAAIVTVINLLNAAQQGHFMD